MLVRVAGRIWFQAFLVLSLIVPYTYGDQVSLREMNEDADASAALFKPAFEKLERRTEPGSFSPLTKESVAKKLEELRKKVNWTAEEKAQLAEIDAWVKRNKDAKALQTLVDLLDKRKVDQAQKEIQEQEKAVASLKKRSNGSPFGNGTFDAMEASCKSGVDEMERRARSFEDKLGSDALKAFREEIGEGLAEAKKKAKADDEKEAEKKIQQILALAEKDPLEQEAKAAKEDVAKKGFSKDRYGFAARKARNAATLKKLQENEIEKKALIALANLYREQRKANNTAAETHEIAERFTSALKGELKKSFEPLEKSLDQLFENCKKNKDIAGTNRNSGLLGKAREWSIAFAQQFQRGDLNFYHNTTFVPQLDKIAENVKCHEVNKAELNDAVKPLYQAMDKMESARDLKQLAKLANGVLQSIPDVLRGLREVPTVTQLKNECNRNAKTVKKAKNYIQMMAAELGAAGESAGAAGGSEGGATPPAASPKAYDTSKAVAAGPASGSAHGTKR